MHQATGKRYGTVAVLLLSAVEAASRCLGTNPGKHLIYTYSKVYTADFLSPLPVPLNTLTIPQNPNHKCLTSLVQLTTPGLTSIKPDLPDCT